MISCDVNGGVDLAGRCLKCGQHVPTSGGCEDCRPKTFIATTIITSPESEEYERASGEVICEACKKPYYRHEWYRGILGYDGEPFLRRICSGKLVKL